RAGMTANGIAPKAQEEIILSITSFALYGFPESHAASFALIAYASAYLKCHYLAAFTAALLNNQPMGFYSPATIVKDAQRHGLKVLPVDVMKSEWNCTLEQVVRPASCVVGEKTALRSRLPAAGETVEGLASHVEREAVLGSGVPAIGARPASQIESENRKCGRILEAVVSHQPSAIGTQPRMERHSLTQGVSPGESSTKTEFRGDGTIALRLGLRHVKGLHEEAGQDIARERNKAPFTSIQDLVRRVPELRKDELNTLAEIGALNSIGNSPPRHKVTARNGNNKSSVSLCLSGENALHRRDALWNAGAAANPRGPLLEGVLEPDQKSPLARMTDEERLVADYRGTGLPIGPHPMPYHRERVNILGVRRA